MGIPADALFGSSLSPVASRAGDWLAHRPVLTGPGLPPSAVPDTFDGAGQSENPHPQAGPVGFRELGDAVRAQDFRASYQALTTPVP